MFANIQEKGSWRAGVCLLKDYEMKYFLKKKNANYTLFLSYTHHVLSYSQLVPWGPVYICHL